MKDLGELGGGFSDARAINERGEIAGVSTTIDNVNHFYVWTKRGGMQDVGAPDGGAFSVRGINERGSFVAFGMVTDGLISRAWLWSPRQGYTDLGNLGAVEVLGNGINDNGQIVGGAGIGDGSLFRAWTWTAATGIREIEARLPGGELSGAASINNSGVIAGFSTDSVDWRAVTWTPLFR
jgi:uncharacterized membrane protein